MVRDFLEVGARCSSPGPQSILHARNALEAVRHPSEPVCWLVCELVCQPVCGPVCRLVCEPVCELVASWLRAGCELVASWLRAGLGAGLGTGCELVCGLVVIGDGLWHPFAEAVRWPRCLAHWEVKSSGFGKCSRVVPGEKF
jgi:hypothetical protein